MMKIDEQTSAEFAAKYKQLESSSPTYRVEGFKIEVEEIIYQLGCPSPTIEDGWPDEDRSYGFLWEAGHRMLLLDVPYDLEKPALIYWQNEVSQTGIEKDVLPESIHHWVKWVAGVSELNSLPT